MNPDLVKLLVGGVIGVHGAGHVLGWMPAWGIARFEGVTSRSWLLTDVFGDGAARALGGALWMAPTIGFVVAAAGLFTGHGWWRPVAIGSAAISLVAIGLFAEALPSGSRIGAVAVNIAVLAGLLLANWPSEATVGS
ncbi:MAG TPA: hypothetical protein VIV06_08800 [Candidatus Limnocylindrales bacterium]